MQVEVYRNLHYRHMPYWSVRLCKRRDYGEDAGRVIRHTTSVYICDALFVVRPAGREKVLRERKKNVHAFVRGLDYHAPTTTLARLEERVQLPADNYFSVREVTYNPFRAGYFYDKATGEEVQAADSVWLIDGRVFCTHIDWRV